MLKITNNINIDENEIKLKFIRASGPGGQNVNKVSSAVQLRFNVKRSPSLPEQVRARLLKLAGRRLTERGVLVIEAKRYRTQERNREDAINRLVELVRKATIQPKHRKKTRPSLKAKQRRIDEKKQRGARKRLRGKVDKNEL